MTQSLSGGNGKIDPPQNATALLVEKSPALRGTLQTQFTLHHPNEIRCPGWQTVHRAWPRPVARATLRGDRWKSARLGLITRIHRNSERGADLRVQAHGDFGLAGFFHRFFQFDHMAINDDAIRFELFVNVHAGH